MSFNLYWKSGNSQRYMRFTSISDLQMKWLLLLPPYRQKFDISMLKPYIYSKNTYFSPAQEKKYRDGYLA